MPTLPRTNGENRMMQQRSKYVSVTRKLVCVHDEQIKQLYESGQSTKQIGKQFGFSKGAIRERLVIIGVKMRKRIDYGFPEETRKKLTAASRGERNHEWKGDKAKPKSGRERARNMFPCPQGKQRHHIDGNPLNNIPENIMFVTPKEHAFIHKVKEKSELRRNKLGQFGSKVKVNNALILGDQNCSTCALTFPICGKKKPVVVGFCRSPFILLNDNQQTEVKKQ
jgi:hypothetical protein